MKISTPTLLKSCKWQAHSFCQKRLNSHVLIHKTVTPIYYIIQKHIKMTCLVPLKLGMDRDTHWKSTELALYKLAPGKNGTSRTTERMSAHAQGCPTVFPKCTLSGLLPVKGSRRIDFRMKRLKSKD